MEVEADRLKGLADEAYRVLRQAIRDLETIQGRIAQSVPERLDIDGFVRWRDRLADIEGELVEIALDIRRASDILGRALR